MKKYTGVINFAGGIIFAVVVLTQVAFKNSVRATNPNDISWHAPAIPKELSFAGEKAPLERWDVREKFDREFILNYYNTGGIIYLLKLANRNFPLISERLKANGVPDDFKYLCIAESNMQAWAVSRSGAVGYWQFMDGTAPGYGLEVNSSVDERQHLEKATDAASKYLKQAYAKFGSWTAAAASYNCGMNGYNNQAAFQRTTNYYDLNLPEETNKYIFRILSFKYLLENAEDLGFVVKDDEKYQPVQTRTVTVTSGIPDLAQFAIDNGTNYKIMRALNPWLKGRSLPAGRTYYIKLPE